MCEVAGRYPEALLAKAFAPPRLAAAEDGAMLFQAEWAAKLEAPGVKSRLASRELAWCRACARTTNVTGDGSVWHYKRTRITADFVKTS